VFRPHNGAKNGKDGEVHEYSVLDDGIRSIGKLVGGVCCLGKLLAMSSEHRSGLGGQLDESL
jgi:hypothetical protein